MSTLSSAFAADADARCKSTHWRVAVTVILGLLVPLSLQSAQPPQKAPEKLPTPAAVGKVAFLLKDRHGHATTERIGTARTGGGNTDVAQPRDDTLVITTTGVAVAGPHPCKASIAVMTFDLTQDLEIVLAEATVKRAKLTVEAQIVGLLRGDRHGGSASVCNGMAAVSSGAVPIVALAIEGHAVDGDDNLAINDHKGPVSIGVLAGEYRLQHTFRISAAHLQGVCGKAASAEFAPDPALDPTWISVTEPFHGAVKKDFGFRVTYRLEAE